MGRAETTLQSLIERARCGDRDAFDELVRRYADMAFRYAISLVGDYGLAEDATQEALASAYLGLSTLRDETAFPAWLRGIVRNQCLRLLRGQRASLVRLEAIGEVPSAGPTPHDGAERAEMRRGVLSAVMLLPQHLREVVILFYGGGYSQRELASFLDLPVTTVNNRLHAARRQLRGGLIEMIHDDAERHPLPGEFAERLGRIIDSRGPLLRAGFASEDAPRPLDAVTSDDGLTYAVMQQLAGGIVRCIALQPRGGPLGGTLADSGRIVDRAVSPDVLRDAVAILLDEAPQASGIVETGIKAIDLFAPLPAAGPIGLYGPQGAGKIVILGELIHRLGSGNARLTILNFVQADTADTLPKDEPLPNAAGALQSFYLPVEDAAQPESPSVSKAGESLAAALYCSRELAQQMLYPALDPLVSWSRQLSSASAGPEHVALASRARELLKEAGNTGDARLGARARRLRLFLTQPFFTTEAYTHTPGEYVSLQQTLEGCAAILSGSYDDVPEEAFRFTGSLGQVLARANG